jgi:hypothetical protein
MKRAERLSVKYGNIYDRKTGNWMENGFFAFFVHYCLEYIT